MIIEIVDKGGIYAYYDNEGSCLYVGKTTREFKFRDREHKRDNESVFDEFFSEERDLELRVLFDCKDCPLTTAQLDYLESCFISLMKPKMNSQKTDIVIDKREKKNMPNTPNKESLTSLTKNAILVYNLLLEAPNGLTIREIGEKLPEISQRTIERAIRSLKDINKLDNSGTDYRGRRLYQIKSV